MPSAEAVAEPRRCRTQYGDAFPRSDGPRAGTLPALTIVEPRPRSMTIRPYEERDRARWDAYVEGHPDSTFAQLSTFGDLMERDGVARSWALAFRGERVVGVLPMFLRTVRERALFSAPGGLLGDDDDVRAALVAHLTAIVRASDLAYAELRDQRHPIDGLPTSNEHVTMVLDLRDTEEAQWHALDSRARRAYRKSERTAFNVSWSRSNVAAFYRVLVENMRDLGTPIRGLRYYSAFVHAFAERCDVLLLSLADEPVGGMLVMRHGDTWSDPWTSSARRFLRLAPNDRIYWEAIRAAIAAGVTRFDFGRSQPGSGTYRFKRKWGAQPVPTAYQYVLGTRRAMPTFAAQCASLAPAAWLWKRLPLHVARLVGDPVKRLFPEVL